MCMCVYLTRDLRYIGDNTSDKELQQTINLWVKGTNWATIITYCFLGSV